VSVVVVQDRAGGGQAGRDQGVLEHRRPGGRESSKSTVVGRCGHGDGGGWRVRSGHGGDEGVVAGRQINGGRKKPVASASTDALGGAEDLDSGAVESRASVVVHDFTFAVPTDGALFQSMTGGLVGVGRGGGVGL